MAHHYILTEHPSGRQTVSEYQHSELLDHFSLPQVAGMARGRVVDGEAGFRFVDLVAFFEANRPLPAEPNSVLVPLLGMVS